MLAPLRFPIAEPYAGGLEAHTHQLARGLAGLGHELTLFAHPDSDPGFNIVPFTASKNPTSSQSLIMYRAALSAIKNGGFDLVHNNSIHFLPPLLARTLSVPMVTTLHTPPYKSHRWTTGAARRSRNHRFVAISRYLAEVWKPFAGTSQVIHNGISLDAFPFRAQVDTQDKSAIWYGRITPDKGTHHAVMAAREAGFELNIAGPVEDEAYFNATIKPFLSDGIRHLGHIDQGQLAHVIGQSSVGILTPEWEEPFGLVCLELLACGTPVAAFQSGAFGEILTPDCSIIVEKGDSRALSRVLCKVAEKQRTACRARAEEFSLESMVAAYANLYHDLTDPNTSGRPRN